MYKFIHHIWWTAPLTVLLVLQGSVRAQQMSATIRASDSVSASEATSTLERTGELKEVESKQDQATPDAANNFVVPTSEVEAPNAVLQSTPIAQASPAQPNSAPAAAAEETQLSPADLQDHPVSTGQTFQVPPDSVDIVVGPANNIVVGQTPIVISQTPNVTPQPTAPPLQFNRITPRVGVGYNSSGPGYDGFGRLEGFVPLMQTPGQSLAFFEGRVLIDNDAHFGANALLGYRFYNPSNDYIFGGYVGYDRRNTDESGFNQIGVGLEALGNIDVRLNGYIPVGETRNTYRTDIFDTGTQVSSPRFQSNQLLFDTFRRRVENRYSEAALPGFDVELGGRLLTLGKTGELRGYSGFYYYNGRGSTDAVGFRLRLEARPTDFLTLGVGVQRDDLFGTQALLSFSATFPGYRLAGVNPFSTRARLGESIQRTNAIVVDNQSETRVTQQQQSGVVAISPVTGQPLDFIFVNNNGAAGGAGTSENPFTSFDQGLITAQAGNVVYVDAGANPGIPGFTVPNNVQVLSRGPQQFVNTQNAGNVPLPGSGTGAFPNVTGTVTVGSNTTLSGFDINPGGNTGVLAPNATGFTVRDNRIRNVDFGVNVEAINGTASGTISGNQISNASIAGVSVASNNGNIPSITISGNQIRDVGIYGIDVRPTTNSTVGSVVVSNNDIANVSVPPALAGIEVEPVNASTITNATISGNTVQNFNFGISVDPIGGSSVRNIAYFSNTITNTQAASFEYVRDSTSTICVSQFNANTVSNPAAGNVALRFDNPFPAAGTGAYQFVNFSSATVQANNTNFSNFSGTGNVTVVSSCP